MTELRAAKTGIYEKALPRGRDWLRKLEAAAKAGHDFLEISIDESDSVPLKEVFTRLERSGFFRPMMHDLWNAGEARMGSSQEAAVGSESRLSHNRMLLL